MNKELALLCGWKLECENRYMLFLNGYEIILDTNKVFVFILVTNKYKYNLHNHIYV